MIIGSDRDEVIENIKRAAESGNFFAKVETHDPVLTTEESNAIINKYLKERGTASVQNAVLRRARDRKRADETCSAVTRRSSASKKHRR